MTDLASYSVQKPLLGPAELMQHLAKGLTEIQAACSFEGNIALILTVPSTHAEVIEEAARQQGVELRRIPPA